MKLTTTRIREMHKCGFSPEVIAKNLREQGHDVEATKNKYWGNNE